MDDWQLTVVYSTKKGNLRVEKCFYFCENPQNFLYRITPGDEPQ